ncbi:hypothetical protein [Domibacillus robiginosus]|uniref:hypothetical protein n=1 Tax=Domibacillus robiginosus TaxID=1071054 RepID=UPI0012E04795|nr:hypothetical protein [Domibacillus robiginosus]
MEYRRAVIGQQWSLKEVQAYCMEKFQSKRPAYPRKTKQLAEKQALSCQAGDGH